MITKKSEDAVSPVIGIMLLVVVTVIIAAVITAFATGVVGSTEPAPVAALDVEILNSENTLSDLKGPELFITHRSGDAVDTKDIELRFSWVCGLDDCESGGVHYSTYSADGFKEEHPNGIMIDRKQALYVKSTMSPERTEYGSVNINHYFGDVILTPGLKLSASSELLNGHENTQSQFMEMVFNNYDDSIEEKGEMTVTYSPATKGGHYSTQSQADYSGIPGAAPCAACNAAADAVENGGNGDGTTKAREWNTYCDNPANWDNCATLKASMECKFCGDHFTTECNEASDPNHECECCSEAIVPGTEYTTGIMTHLPAGTAVDVMIIHTPSGKAIYDKTVIVQ